MSINLTEDTLTATINTLVAKQKRQAQALQITTDYLVTLREFQKQILAAKK